MVKNISGGSKYKKMASKNFKNCNQKNLRIAEDENELYGIIIKKLGGGHVMVLGINGTEYMCHIGGKFKNERINLNDFVLIGLREWQSSNNKKNMTDLLEVYSENEKNKLIETNKNNWNVLLRADNSFVENNDEIKFANDTEINYSELFDEKNKNIDIKPLFLNDYEEKSNDDWINDI